MWVLVRSEWLRSTCSLPAAAAPATCLAAHQQWLLHGGADAGSCCLSWQVRQYLDFFRQSGKFSVAYLNAGGEKVWSCAPP